MKKLLTSIAIVGAITAAAAPALAQPHRGYDDRGRAEYQMNLRDGREASARAQDALNRANRVLHSGRVSRRDTAVIHAQAGDLSKARARYSGGGWTRNEIQDLNRRTAELNASIDRAGGGRMGWNR